jgi:hypothetical protein
VRNSAVEVPVGPHQIATIEILHSGSAS